MENFVDYIIIGNGVAGTTAAEVIRANGMNGSIKIFTDEKYPFYARIRLPQFLAGEIALEKLILKNREWYREQTIDLHLNEGVISADSVNKTVTTKDGSVFSYKKLLIAAGSRSFLPPLEGMDLEGVFSLRNIDDAVKIKEYIKGKKKGVIIGGGLLGLEAGKALMCHGIEICIVEYFDRLLPRQVDVEGAEVLRCMMERLGYCFRLGLHTERIIRENGRLKALMHDGTHVLGDIVLVSAGVRPNLTLPKRLNLTINKGILVNDYMQTSNPDIFAAGDVCEHNGKFYGSWPAAKDQGKVAGRNMLSISMRYNGTLMTKALKVAGIDLVSIGEVEPAGKNQCIVNADTENGIYKKYIIKDDTLIGCILLGDTKDKRKIESAIKEKKRVTEIKEIR